MATRSRWFASAAIVLCACGGGSEPPDGQGGSSGTSSSSTGSSSSGTGSSGSSSSGTGAGDACSKLAMCCPKLPDPSWVTKCQEDAAAGNTANCEFDNWYYTMICG